MVGKRQIHRRPEKLDTPLAAPQYAEVKLSVNGVVKDRQWALQTPPEFSSEISVEYLGKDQKGKIRKCIQHSAGNPTGLKESSIIYSSNS